MAIHVGDTVAGFYKVDEVLESGPPTSLFVATRTSDGKRVTVKLLDPDMAADPHLGRFRREAEVMRRVDHPLIPAILDYVSEGKDHYLVTELCTGETLESRLKTAGALAPLEVAKHMNRLLYVLAILHRNQIVHR